MSTADAALMVAVISFFLLAWLFVRQNDLEKRVADLDREHRAKEVAQQRTAMVTILHHRGADPKGYFLLHNLGGVPATDVTLNIRKKGDDTGPEWLIPNDNAGWDSIGPNQRVTIETTSARPQQWPVEVLLTWNDPNGPHAEMVSVNR